MSRVAIVEDLVRARTQARYLEHLLRVAAMGRSDRERITALLHDLVEDGLASWNEVEALLGDDAPEILPALKLLTRGDEPYAEYIDTIATTGNLLALTVKSFDLIDHLAPAQWPSLRDELRERYIPAFARITTAGQALIQSRSGSQAQRHRS
jgi:hypothetical protein